MENSFYFLKYNEETENSLLYHGYKQLNAGINPLELNLFLIMNKKEKQFWISGTTGLEHAKSLQPSITEITLKEFRKWHNNK